MGCVKSPSLKCKEANPAAATPKPPAPGPNISGIVVVAFANVPPFLAKCVSSAFLKLSLWYLKGPFPSFPSTALFVSLSSW
ncbi:hypothetical protein D3C76_976060 [compost metagenome]